MLQVLSILNNTNDISDVHNYFLLNYPSLYEMVFSYDRSKSLQELEGEDWGPPTYDSNLVTTCHQLRRKPLDEFTVEDLRIMIGQGIGLVYLVPIAIDILEENPLAGGNFYPGDLLGVVLNVDREFWGKNQDLWWRVDLVIHDVMSIKETIEDVIMHAAQTFREAMPGHDPG